MLVGYQQKLHKCNPATLHVDNESLQWSKLRNWSCFPYKLMQNINDLFIYLFIYLLIYLFIYFNYHYFLVTNPCDSQEADTLSLPTGALGPTLLTSVFFSFPKTPRSQTSFGLLLCFQKFLVAYFEISPT